MSSVVKKQGTPPQPLHPQFRLGHAAGLTEIVWLRDALAEIEERTRPSGDMADQAVNALACKALSRRK